MKRRDEDCKGMENFKKFAFDMKERYIINVFWAHQIHSGNSSWVCSLTTKSSNLIDIVITCISGKELSVTWSRLASTADVGATSITLKDSVENIWKAGDQIVIATTGHRHTQVNKLEFRYNIFSNRTTLPPKLHPASSPSGDHQK